MAMSKVKLAALFAASAGALLVCGVFLVSRSGLASTESAHTALREFYDSELRGESIGSAGSLMTEFDDPAWDVTAVVVNGLSVHITSRTSGSERIRMPEYFVADEVRVRGHRFFVLAKGWGVGLVSPRVILFRVDLSHGTVSRYVIALSEYEEASRKLH